MIGQAELGSPHVTPSRIFMRLGESTFRKDSVSPLPSPLAGLKPGLPVASRLLTNSYTSFWPDYPDLGPEVGVCEGCQVLSIPDAVMWHKHCSLGNIWKLSRLFAGKEVWSKADTEHMMRLKGAVTGSRASMREAGLKANVLLILPLSLSTQWGLRFSAYLFCKPKMALF